MTVLELIKRLSELEDWDMEVCVEDGLDPSDSEPIRRIEIKPNWFTKEPCVHLESR